MGRCGKFTYYMDKGTSKTHPNLQANLCYYRNDLYIYWNRDIPKEKTAAKYDFAKYANHAKRQNNRSSCRQRDNGQVRRRQSESVGS